VTLFPLPPVLTPALNLLTAAAMRAEDVAALVDASRHLTVRTNALRRPLVVDAAARAAAQRTGHLRALADDLEEEALNAANDTVSLVLKACTAAQQSSIDELPLDFCKLCSGLSRSMAQAVDSIRTLREARCDALPGAPARPATLTAAPDSHAIVAQLMQRLRGAPPQRGAAPGGLPGRS
jgi:hypothetical protein